MSCFVLSCPATNFIVLIISLALRLWVIAVFRTGTIGLRKFFIFGILNLLLTVILVIFVGVGLSSTLCLLSF